VPRPIAHIICQEPQLVAAAVEACYYRTQQDARAAARMTRFPPADLVDVSVRFSRCQYAQLMGQQLPAPRGWPLPLPSAPDFKAADLGLKLAVGFEVAASSGAGPAAGRAAAAAAAAAGPAAAAAPASREAGPAATADAAAGPAAAAAGAAETGAAAAPLREADVASSPAWQAYRASLDSSGFFRGELQGSQLHRQLLAAALHAFAGGAAYSAATRRLSRPAERLQQTLAQQQGQEAQGACPGLGLPGLLLPEDDDGWLTSWGEGLEQELLRREGEQQQAQGAAAGPAGEVELDAADMAERLRGFVGHLSSFEGAEVPAAGAPGPGAAGGDVSLDMGAFLSELQRALGAAGGAGGGGGGGGGGGRRQQQQPRDPLYADLEGAPLGGGRGGGGGGGGGGSSSEGSSFYEGSESGGEDADSDSGGSGGPAAAARPQRPSQSQLAAGREVLTATDSDDDEGRAGGSEAGAGVSGGDFLEAYDLAMQAELASTDMALSFGRPPGASAAEGGRGAGAVGGPAAAAGAEEAAAPVDVDLNLVRSLVESFAAQQGLPGPAGNLAGLLGLQLPAGGAGPAAANK
jgi:HPt (histidine-containing phosphotransfer) domain-containing protein